MTYVVLGASGHTGRVVAETLLAAGLPVRAVGRQAARLQPLATLGATTAIGDQHDAAFLAEAFRGATAVYALFPPDYQAHDWAATYGSLATALVQGLRAAGRPRTVFLSSLGAQHPAGLGPISLLHRAEQQLTAVEGLDFAILRPGYFFENFFPALGTIRQFGINGGLIRGDLPISMVATHDIGVVAAELLRAPAPLGGRIRELLGPRDYTLRETTTLLGRALGLPELPYVEMPADQMRGALLGGGFSPDVARLYVEMMDGFNRGLGVSAFGRSAESTTPTTFESFVPALAAAYAAQG